MRLPTHAATLFVLFATVVGANRNHYKLGHRHFGCTCSEPYPCSNFSHAGVQPRATPLPEHATLHVPPKCSAWSDGLTPPLDDAIDQWVVLKDDPCACVRLPMCPCLRAAVCAWLCSHLNVTNETCHCCRRYHACVRARTHSLSHTHTHRPLQGRTRTALVTGSLAFSLRLS